MQEKILSDLCRGVINEGNEKQLLEEYGLTSLNECGSVAVLQILNPEQIEEMYGVSSKEYIIRDIIEMLNGQYADEIHYTFYYQAD
jgi:hypothetical protein